MWPGGLHPAAHRVTHPAHQPRRDIRPLGSLQIWGIPLPPEVFFIFNPVVTGSEPDLFQMSSDLVIPETTPKVEADEDLNSSLRWEPAVFFSQTDEAGGWSRGCLQGPGGPPGFSR